MTKRSTIEITVEHIEGGNPKLGLEFLADALLLMNLDPTVLEALEIARGTTSQSSAQQIHRQALEAQAEDLRKQLAAIEAQLREGAI